MDTRLDVPVLRGSLVRLEPLAPAHAPDLARAAEEDRSAYRFTLVPRAGRLREYVAAQLTRPGLPPFAQVRLRDGRAVGCTSYCTPRLYPERSGWYATEIGWTWLAASALGLLGQVGLLEDQVRVNDLLSHLAASPPAALALKS